LPAPEFRAVGKLSENFLVVGKFFSKNAKFWAEIFGKFKGKIEILSTSSVGNLQLSVGKLQLPARLLFYTRRR